MSFTNRYTTAHRQTAQQYGFIGALVIGALSAAFATILLAFGVEL